MPVLSKHDWFLHCLSRHPNATVGMETALNRDTNYFAAVRPQPLGVHPLAMPEALLAANTEEAFTKNRGAESRAERTD